jgi:hypothetical protein
VVEQQISVQSSHVLALVNDYDEQQKLCCVYISPVAPAIWDELYRFNGK